MQPIISPVDHESRHKSHQEADDEGGGPSEDTPLLHRFPHSGTVEQPNRSTAAAVALLVLALASGVVIGVYLLVLQNHAEHILPPVDEPLQLVSRAQWDPGAVSPLAMSPLAMSPFKATRVIAMQTDTQPCWELDSCVALLRDMQAQSSKANGLPYNFLVSSSGQAFEALGWRRASPLELSALVLAFIGNFTQTPPSREQLAGARRLLAESVSLQHLVPMFSIYGKQSNQSAAELFHSLQALPQWRSELSH